MTNHFDPGKRSLGKVEAVAMLLRDYQAAKETAKKYGITVLWDWQRNTLTRMP